MKSSFISFAAVLDAFSKNQTFIWTGRKAYVYTNIVDRNNVLEVPHIKHMDLYVNFSNRRKALLIIYQYQ